MPIGRNSAYMHGGSSFDHYHRPRPHPCDHPYSNIIILVIIPSNIKKIISGNVTPSFYHYQHIATAQGLKSKPFLQVSIIN